MSPVTTHVEHRFVKVILISVSLLAMIIKLEGPLNRCPFPSVGWLSLDTQAVLKSAAVIPSYSLSIL